MTSEKAKLVPRPSVAPYHRHPLHEYLLGAAAGLGGKTAIVDGGQELTFTQLKDRTANLASALAAMGIGKGDRVAIFAPNCWEYVASFYAISWIGAVVTTLNPSYREREVEFQLRDSGARAIILAESLYPVLEPVLPRLSGILNVIVIGGSAGKTSHSFEDLTSTMSDGPPAVVIDPEEDVVVLPYSSGTTGLPKGVMLTHSNLTSNVDQLIGRREIGAPKPDDVLMVHLPLYHIYGMNVIMNVAVALGATQVMMGRFEMEQFLHLLSDNRVTVLYTVPPVVLALTQFPGIRDYDLSALRLCFVGAAPMSAELQTKLESTINVATVQGYGLTESSPATNADFMEPSLKKPGSVGPPLPDTEEKVVDLETGERELPRGELGELIIKGPQVMKGYWNNPDATADTLRDGWLYTGDIASMDEEGYVSIMDRKKELIKYKGFQVAPAELEGLLLEHPSVSDAAVIGVPNEEAGEVPKAFVVATGAVSAGEIMEWVAGQVAGFKQIRQVEFLDQIPKNPSGKVLRRVLVEQERERGQA